MFIIMFIGLLRKSQLDKHFDNIADIVYFVHGTLQKGQQIVHVH